MKRIALVLCATASLFSGVSAMDSAQQESGTSFEVKTIMQNQLEISPKVDPLSQFTVNTVPPIRVNMAECCADLAQLSKDHLLYEIPEIAVLAGDDLIISDINIDLQGKYKDVELKSPLKLDYKMTKEQVISALFLAFGDDKEIKYELFGLNYINYDYEKCVEEIFTKKH